MVDKTKQTLKKEFPELFNFDWEKFGNRLRELNDEYSEYNSDQIASFVTGMKLVEKPDNAFAGKLTFFSDLILREAKDKETNIERFMFFCNLIHIIIGSIEPKIQVLILEKVLKQVDKVSEMNQAIDKFLTK